MQRVLRWAVPVDDQWHEIGAGYVVETSARQSFQRPGDLVEIWTLEDTPDGDPAEIPMRSVTVVGTGHPVPENTDHVGTAVVPTFHVVSGPIRGAVEHVESVAGLVWHVFAQRDPEAGRAALAEQGRRLGCPDCGQSRIIGYRMDNEHGDHMHTHYVCTFWAKGAPKACGWHGWSVPGWDAEPEES